MARLHENTLKLAEGLLLDGRFGSASLRRCVSSAYYALFQRLSYLCASRLSGSDASSEEYIRLYRALDHKQARMTLNKIHKSELGVRFELLQDIRHWADYSITPHPDLELAKAGKNFSPDDAQDYLKKAREAVLFIDKLSPADQRKLAILLVIRDR